MIDLRGRRAKLNYWRVQNRLSANIERVYFKKIAIVLKKQYSAANKNILSGKYTDIDNSVDKYNADLLQLIEELLTKTSEVFFNEAERALMKKDRQNDFWAYALKFIKKHSADEVVRVSYWTKKSIKKILEKGLEAGKSNREIAKDIRKVSGITNSIRASRITRTEVHTMNQNAIDRMMRNETQIKEKEWVSALDTRTREVHAIANGERVDIDDTFSATGEPLKYPGDPAGSPWNIINCRCVAIYHTQKGA